MAAKANQSCVLCGKEFHGKDPISSLKRHMWEIHGIRLQVNRVYSFTRVTETVVASASVDVSSVTASSGQQDPLPELGESIRPSTDLGSFDDDWFESYIQELVASVAPGTDGSAMVPGSGGSPLPPSCSEPGDPALPVSSSDLPPRDSGA